MSKKDTKTKILNDGLRYRSKLSGSPFKGSTFMGANTTMSCFLCGQHRDRSFLVSRKFVGKQQLCCTPSCKELDAILAAEKAQPGSL